MFSRCFSFGAGLIMYFNFDLSSQLSFSCSSAMISLAFGWIIVIYFSALISMYLTLSFPYETVASLDLSFIICYPISYVSVLPGCFITTFRDSEKSAMNSIVFNRSTCTINTQVFLPPSDYSLSYFINVIPSWITFSSIFSRLPAIMFQELLELSQIFFYYRLNKYREYFLI